MGYIYIYIILHSQIRIKLKHLKKKKGEKKNQINQSILINNNQPARPQCSQHNFHQSNVIYYINI